MAYDIGTVDNTGSEGLAHWQMLDKIKTFAEGHGWTTLRYLTPSDGSNRELILKGVGLSGDQEIYIGFRTYHSISADYYNLSVAGFTGYVDGNTFATQPGYIESGIPAHNLRIDYWLAVNAQRIAVGLKVGTPVYESGYAGYILPYATPGQFPYPLFVGGSLNGPAATRYSDTSHSFYLSGNKANARLRFVDGTWHQPSAWPWTCPGFTGGVTGNLGTLRDTGGCYQMLPVVLTEGDGGATPNIYGELDGVRQISGFSNVVENMLQIGGTPVDDDPSWTSAQRAAAIADAGGTPWVVMQNVGRTGFTDYYALRLD
jgi:hypothetical protein